jgi:hypothetical protein
MSQGFNSPPKVLLAQLRQYTSRSGNTYLTGYAGAVRFVLLQDYDAPITGQETARWNLFVEQAPPREERRPANDAPGRAPLLQLEHHAGPMDNSPARLSPPRKTGASASDRRAAELLRERGIDPDAPIVDDTLSL